MKNIIAVIVVIILVTACTGGQKIIFDSEIVIEDNLKTINYIPETDFVRFTDSAYQYMTKQDYSAVLSGELFKGETIYKNDEFLIKTMLRSYARNSHTKHELILRTFKHDMRLLDDIVISSTADSIPFSGKLNSDLTYKISYENGESTTGKINEKGRFIAIDNE